MSPKTNKILFLVGIFSLIILLFLEIFLDYDTAIRQLALTLTNAESLLIILIIYWFFNISTNYHFPANAQRNHKSISNHSNQ